MSNLYQPETQTRQEVDVTKGALVLDFGANWCSHCQAARPFIDAAFSRHPDVAHTKIEDGQGRKLGRSFRVKLWPSLIFLRDGREVARVVRPTDGAELERAFDTVKGAQ